MTRPQEQGQKISILSVSVQTSACGIGIKLTYCLGGAETPEQDMKTLNNGKLVNLMAKWRYEVDGHYRSG